MKIILIRAKDSTIVLKMRKNAQNSKINLMIKIIAMISFICFNKSRMKRAMIQKTIEIAIIIRKNILLRLVLKLSKRIFKLTL